MDTGTDDALEAAPPFELSGLQRTLEEVWACIRDVHPELPDVVMMVGAGAHGRRLRKLGHWSAFRWRVRAQAGLADQGEVMIAGERLRDGAADVLETLLHEAAHAIATVRGVEDTSREGRYHNARYRDLAHEVGLDVEQHDTYGWAITSLRPETRTRYEAQLVMLGLSLGGWRHRPNEIPADPRDLRGPEGRDDDARGGRKADTRGRAVLLTCACPTPRKIRAYAAIVAQGPILCGVCNAPFVAPVATAATTATTGEA